MAAGNKSNEGYNRYKKHNGSQYTGMRIGGSHKWYYDKGEWKERKVKPDEWDIYYETIKRRAGKAPEKSGAPVGTEYNWLIVSHQRVDKLDANSYLTQLEGKKFKVAHKRASKYKWNIKEKTQRKKVIEYLEQVISELKEMDEEEHVPYSVGEHERIYGLQHKNVKELSKIAAVRNIKNRSKMRRAELLEAVENTLNGQEKKEPKQKKSDLRKLQSRTKSDLYEMASKRDIHGRSQMKKNELVKALAEE